MAGGRLAEGGGASPESSPEYATELGLRRGFHQNEARSEGILTTLLAKVERGSKQGCDGGAASVSPELAGEGSLAG